MRKLMLKDLIERAMNVFDVYGNIPVCQWSECDEFWFATLSANRETITVPEEFRDGGAKEIIAFCLDYT